MLLLTFTLSAFGITWEAQTSSTDRALLFAEGFEDKKLESRGWYDRDRFVLSDDAVAEQLQAAVARIKSAKPAKATGKGRRKSQRAEKHA